MLKLEYLKQLLIVGLTLSTITCAFVQKTKKMFNSTKYLCFYSFIVNMVLSVIFCRTFTSIDFPLSLWVGFFSFIGADTIYKSLEGKISSYGDLVTDDTIKVKKENIIDTGRNT